MPKYEICDSRNGKGHGPKRSFERIVSLAPALTEILYALGEADRVVGVTDSCDHPAAVHQKPNVACWFEPDLLKLFTLEPDLVLGLETAHRALEPELERRGIQVILVNPASIEAALGVMMMLGELLDAARGAQICVQNLQARLAELDRQVGQIPLAERLTVCRVLDLYEDQLMVAGPLSFQYDVISRAGGLNVTGQLRKAYPKVSLARFRQWDPHTVFFCGNDRQFIPRLLANPNWHSLQAVQAGRVFQFDCALTCRTGPRIVDMAELLFKTLYADRGALSPSS
ncbi:MAG: ABC transporter substrate-binding protein [Desulfobacterales bacterium]|nr:MAG: ABC transporter substrate-binding protein [Desulfobacterales bacterium]